MARDFELQSQKRQEIVAYFNKLSSVMEFGVKKFTIAYCTAATAQKFFLRPKTVESYLYSQTPIRESHHTNHFGSVQQELPLL